MNFAHDGAAGGELVTFLVDDLALCKYCFGTTAGYTANRADRAGTTGL